MPVSRWMIIVLLCISFGAYAQHDSAQQQTASAIANTADTNIRIIASPGIKTAVAKVQQYQQLSNGTFPGYRIQIHFGQDRTNATKAKTDFSTKYSLFPSYLSYQQPYFKVCIGDFRTKLEAVRALNSIKKDYPGAFVVRDKINPPPLK